MIYLDKVRWDKSRRQDSIRNFDMISAIKQPSSFFYKTTLASMTYITFLSSSPVIYSLHYPRALYSPLLYYSLLYSTLSPLLHSSLLYSTLLYSPLLYWILLYSTLSSVLYSTLLYSTLHYATLLRNYSLSSTYFFYVTVLKFAIRLQNMCYRPDKLWIRSDVNVEK